MTVVNIGKIISSFGVKGQVKVLPLSDFLERCYQLKEVTLFFPGSGHKLRTLVKNSLIHGRCWVLHLEGCSTKEEALSLKGALLQIPAKERVVLPKNQYYFDEIIGLKAITTEGFFLGNVTDILQTGSNDVYVVRFPKEAKDILIPALKHVVVNIDLDKGQIILDLPEGLLEVYGVSL